MKNTVLALVALFGCLTAPAFSQHIVGYTALGSFNNQGNIINSAPNPVTNKIYVSDSTAPTVVSVINGSSHTVIATIPVGSGGALLSVNSTTNTIYALNGDQTVSVIDGSVDHVTATIPAVTSDNCLSNMAVDDSANKLVLLDGCTPTAYVLDGSSYTLLSTISIPVSGTVTAAVNSATHLLYVAYDFDSAYAVVNLMTGTANKVSVNVSLYGIAIDRSLNRIYFGDDISEAIYAFNGATNAQVASITLDYNAYSLAVNENSHILAVSDNQHTIRFYRGFSLAADGQVAFHSNAQIIPVSANSAKNLFYAGVFPINALAFIQGPAH